ncbi:unnamed protein product [Ambrosiozyma monospora]|uniref:Unnamed protein product n=1 Tax=Ambrosiozyma monospora TaxID=43982 RepID=A0ACB5TCH1_AMBMO|nr:unnamed protein product [Ambrosiozyma monospora]
MDQPVILPIQLKPSNLRPLAYRVLSKKHGLNIQSGALEILSEYIGRKFGNEWRGPKTISFLEKIAKIWKDQDKGLFVDGPSVSMIINEITSKEERETRRNHAAAATTVTASTAGNKLDSLVTGANEEPDFEIHQDRQSQSLFQPLSVPDLTVEPKERLRWQEYFKIVPISNYKRFKYNSKRRQFDYTQPPSTEEEDAKFNLIELPSTQDTINYFISRLNILKDKLLRNESFQPSTFSALNSTASTASNTTSHHQITSIKNLLGRHGQRFVLFGLLTKNSKGLWQLQDESDSIELELTQAIFPRDTCFFVPGNFVIVDGIYSSSGKFYASSMAHPPPERREVSLEALGNMDFTGMYVKNGRIDPVLKKKLLSLETKSFLVS